MRYTDKQLIAAIADNLSAYQEVLVEHANSGNTYDQEIEPTLRLTLDQLKKLTGRSRCRQAFIDAIIDGLFDAGLEAHYIDGEGISITKRAERLEVEFDSLNDLLQTVKKVEHKKAA